MACRDPARSGKASEALSSRYATAVVPDGSPVTTQETRLPSGTTAVAYRLDSASDAFPDLAGSRQAIPLPDACTGGQGNDDQWWAM